ncbi:REM2- and Rab-like small GTPase 1 [Exaiptasia diaphana]|nr:REM2- and Rab-like small GTPase 1 [Exaiptasia diaphana]
MSRPRGSIVQFNWQDSPEGREYFAGILRRNRRKIFGLLEIPSLPMQSPPDIINYKIVLYGKPGIGKTSTIAKLSGQGHFVLVYRFYLSLHNHRTPSARIEFMTTLPFYDCLGSQNTVGKNSCQDNPKQDQNTDFKP